MSMQDSPYRVFISSTTRDLQTYRDRVAKALSAAGHVPVVMRDFAPNDQGALAASLQNVRSCDIYVILVGYRFGTPAPDDRTKSVTQREFEEALRNGKLTLAYIPPPPPPGEARVESLVRSYFQGALDDQSAEQEQRQLAFIARLRDQSMIYLPATYDDPNLLHSMVVTAILYGMQGRIPGEITFRRGETALRNGNLDAAIDQLAMAVAYFSSLVGAPSVVASAPADDRPYRTGETPAHVPPFLLALCLMRNRSPSVIPSDEIVGIEDNLKRSLRARATLIAYYAWAYIKWEHYIRRGIVRPHQQELDQIARQSELLAASPSVRQGDEDLAPYLHLYFRDLAARLTASANSPQLFSFRRAAALLSLKGVGMSS